MYNVNKAEDKLPDQLLFDIKKMKMKRRGDSPAVTVNHVNVSVLGFRSR